MGQPSGLYLPSVLSDVSGNQWVISRVLITPNLKLTRVAPKRPHAKWYLALLALIQGPKGEIFLVAQPSVLATHQELSSFTFTETTYTGSGIPLSLWPKL